MQKPILLVHTQGVYDLQRKKKKKLPSDAMIELAEEIRGKH